MGTTTPIRGLYKPLVNEVGWDAKVNANFDNLDTTADKSYVDAGVATAEKTANKDAANGYAGLDSGGLLKTSEAPTWNQNTTGTAANLSGTPALPNGTSATTQTRGDQSTKLATTALVDADLTGGVGVFLPSFQLALIAATTNSAIVNTANQQMGHEFVALYTVTVSNVTVEVGTGVAGALMGIALFAADGVTKLASADSFSVDTTHTGRQRIALSQSVKLVRGQAYWVVWTITSNVAAVENGGLLSGTYLTLMNGKAGISGTGTSGGATNAAVGTLATGTMRIPCMLFD